MARDAAHDMFRAIQRLDRREEEGEPDLGKGRWLVMDSPAAFHGKNLSHALKIAQKVLIPVQPSVFDMAATSAFLQSIRDEKTIRKNKAFVGIVGVRVDPRTKAAATLEAFLGSVRPPRAELSSGQPDLSQRGLQRSQHLRSPALLTERDHEQWAPVLDWVGSAG